MAMEVTPAQAGRAVDALTVPEALRRTAAAHPDLTAVRTLDDSVSLSWAELLARVDAVAGGLSALGLRRGDTAALMLSNRPEFHIVDLAVATLGATPFSVYVTYPGETVRYLARDARARVAVVEQAFLPVMLEAREGLESLEHVIVVDGSAGAGVISLAEVAESGRRFDAAASCARVAADDLLTLIYTSDTRVTQRTSSSRSAR